MCMGVSLFSTDNANGMSVSMPNRIDLPLPLVIFNHVFSTNSLPTVRLIYYVSLKLFMLRF